MVKVKTTYTHKALISDGLSKKEKNDSKVKKLLHFTYIEKPDKKTVTSLNKVNVLFSHMLSTKRPELIKHTPYKISIFDLVEKNQWTSGTYVAIDQPDGILNLHLSFEKIKEMEQFPFSSLTWVLFHEFRHKIQATNENNIRSVSNYSNWKNFNEWMQKLTGKDEDLINHIFHELNPSEVDANVFACEMTGLAFNGNLFDINDQSLGLLGLKVNNKKK